MLGVNGHRGADAQQKCGRRAILVATLPGDKPLALHWSHRSLPELSHLTKAEQDAAWNRCMTSVRLPPGPGDVEAFLNYTPKIIP